MDEVRALFGAEDGLETRRVQPSQVVADLDGVCSRTELLEATWQGVSGRAQTARPALVAAYNALAEAPGEAFLCAAWGAHVETRRDSREAFDEYDGVLSGDAAMMRLISSPEDTVNIPEKAVRSPRRAMTRPVPRREALRNDPNKTPISSKSGSRVQSVTGIWITLPSSS